MLEDLDVPKSREIVSRDSQVGKKNGEIFMLAVKLDLVYGWGGKDVEKLCNPGPIIP